MVYQYLEEHELVDFTEASTQIHSFFAEAQTILPVDSPAAVSAIDLMHLNAAEITVLFDEPAPPRGTALRVSARAPQLALSATDCGPFFGHDPRENPQLWDVTFLGSDASKLAWLAGSESVQTVAQRFERIAQELADLYEKFPDPMGYGTRDSLALRAAIWRAKIAVVLREEDLAPIRAAHSAVAEAQTV